MNESARSRSSFIGEPGLKTLILLIHTSGNQQDSLKLL